MNDTLLLQLYAKYKACSKLKMKMFYRWYAKEKFNKLFCMAVNIALV